MLPSIFRENFFEDVFSFPSMPDFRAIDKALYGKNAMREMKTDISEHDDHFEVAIDLPGFDKDQINLSLENGYLTVRAAKDSVSEETDKAGKVIRKERYSGSLQRSFGVGDDITEEDVKARYENGVLLIDVAKKDATKLPEKKVIAIQE